MCPTSLPVGASFGYALYHSHPHRIASVGLSVHFVPTNLWFAGRDKSKFFYPWGSGKGVVGEGIGQNEIPTK